MTMALDPADLAACRSLLRHGSKSFFAASLLLPRAVREPATALYAFCRVADDAIDHAGDAEAALTRMGARLDAIYGACPHDCPEDRALAAVVHGFSIPRALLDALLEGFAWDTTHRRYDTLEDIEAYGARVAGTVGVMMSLLMGGRAPWTLARAADLGVAMQLTNIARDVGEDARSGRLYLPEDWLREEGLSPETFLSNPVFDDRIGRITGRLLDRARFLYERSSDGIGALPLECRPAIHAARLIYGDIARAIRQNGCNSIDRRAVVSKSRKLALVGEALAASSLSHGRRPAPPLPANRFLIEAVEGGPETGNRYAPLHAPQSRVSRVLDIFEALERRDLQGSAPTIRVRQ